MDEATLNEWVETSAHALLVLLEDVMSERTGSFAEREASAMAVANSLVRKWMQRELGRIASRFEDEILVDGQRHRRHTQGSVRYHTLCGSISVTRSTYRKIGVHNGPTVVPLELEAGIVHNATPALANSVLQAFAAMPLRQYEDEMRGAHRVVPSRSTLERIAKRTGVDLHNELPIIEPVVRASEVVPDAASSISVGVDRTTIPMAEQLPALPERWHRQKKRRPPPPVVVAYRMAYVATVAINDERGDTIASKRIAATADEGPIEMMERLGAELHHVLGQRPDLPVVVVQDGAPELWNLVEEWFQNFEVPITMKIIDRYHLDERLAQLAEIFEHSPQGRRRLLDRWHAALNRSDTAIRRICREIETRTYEAASPFEAEPDDPYDTENPFGPDWKADPIRIPRFGRHNTHLADGHLGYCRNNVDRMRYASARRLGYPIGSGVTEGACKSVIAARLKRSGQRWFELGASVCLQLRTLYLNGRLTTSLDLLVEERRASLA